MTDKQKNINNGLDGLDDQIVAIVNQFIKRRKQHYEAVAQKLYAELKEDTKRYGGLLADEKIKTEDFELLVKGRWAQLKIELLAEAAVSKKKFEDIAVAVLKLTIRTVMALV